MRRKPAGIEEASRKPRLIFIDVETTGLYPQRGHRIIEIGAVAVLMDGTHWRA